MDQFFLESELHQSFLFLWTQTIESNTYEKRLTHITLVSRVFVTTQVEATHILLDGDLPVPGMPHP